MEIAKIRIIVSTSTRMSFPVVGNPSAEKKDAGQAGMTDEGASRRPDYYEILSNIRVLKQESLAPHLPLFMKKVG